MAGLLNLDALTQTITAEALKRDAAAIEAVNAADVDTLRANYIAGVLYYTLGQEVILALDVIKATRTFPTNGAILRAATAYGSFAEHMECLAALDASGVDYFNPEDANVGAKASVTAANARECEAMMRAHLG